MLDAERNTIQCGDNSVLSVLPVAAGAKIYAGGLVGRNSAGYAEPASDKAGLIVYGRAEETVDNTNGENGDTKIEVLAGRFGYAASGLTAADAGKECFITDDETVNLSGGTHRVFAGFIVEVEAADIAIISVGPELRAAVVVPETPVAAAVAAVSAANAGTQTASYVQADVQAIADLANANKTQLNAVISALKTAGLMSA